MPDSATTLDAAAPPERAAPKFVHGSTARHVVVMTATASLGLMAIFVVDLLNLFYIARLGDTVLTAAVGYASTILFVTTSICIGLMIATGALCSRALGAGDRPLARRLAASSIFWMFAVTMAVALVSLPLIRPMLAALGAMGRTLDVAATYLTIATPTVPVMGLGMAFAGVLRSVGDARRAMYVTLSGAVVAAVLDPLLILFLGWGVPGAAVVLVFSRLVVAYVGYRGAVRLHDLVARPTLAAARADAPAIAAIAGPAVLANLATPVAAGYMTAVLSPFGDAAIAANAVMGRLVPVCFGAVFALSGAVGPILGQNLGAGRLDRVRRTLTDSFLLVTAYVVAVWVVLALARHGVVAVFGITDRGAAALVEFFCLFVAGSWVFHGLLFVANAAFNNLGFPLTSTGFNWGKATLGTVPFAMAGAAWWGAEGALAGQGVGAVLFGLAAVRAAYRAVGRLAVGD
ncbi:MATE family efflux transporter [Labrys wisconsinensis]|uniref:MATE family efflux protein n=1 Tax=Labrys wisconsinensis TaxID=425677 RepID=A0ABU0J830_9HYPH|nr:MATE family efflux transporter [Labrys wisconsinensis]MDQ0470420.1 putative MATE family efflux protein [Labrys wisconsinensis]